MSAGLWGYWFSRQGNHTFPVGLPVLGSSRPSLPLCMGSPSPAAWPQWVQQVWGALADQCHSNLVLTVSQILWMGPSTRGSSGGQYLQDYSEEVQGPTHRLSYPNGGLLTLSCVISEKNQRHSTHQYISTQLITNMTY